jgi:hypothetical protein
LTRVYNNILIFLLVWNLAVFAKESIPGLEKRLEQMQAQIDSLDRVLTGNMKKMDSLAVKAAELKSRPELSFFERRKLENILKNSQQMDAQQESLILQYQGFLQRRSDVFQRLDGRYTATIDSLLYLMESTQVSGQVKRQWAEKVDLWQDKLARLHSNGPGSIPQLVPDRNPSVASHDMPDDLNAKADFYRDRRDMYLLKARELDERIGKVRDESKLRRRMSEMVDDVRLFDQRDEPYSPKASSSSAAQTGVDGEKFNDNEIWNNYDGMGGVGNTTVLHEADQFLQYDYRTAPVYDMDDYLARLEIEKKKILSAADSISTIIKDYEEQARELRKSVDRPDK